MTSDEILSSIQSGARLTCRFLVNAPRARDIIEVADGIADMLYVVFGAAVTYGLDAKKLFDEVHRSNMTKVWEDGTIRRREDGKILKPPTYSPANISTILIDAVKAGAA